VGCKSESQMHLQVMCMKAKVITSVCLDAEIVSPPTQTNMFRIEIVEYSTNIGRRNLKVKLVK
jgi:hypothetical protein